MLACGLVLALVWICQSLFAQQSQASRTAFEPLKARAAKGDAQSQCELGVAFLRGEPDVTKDEVEAVRWFRLAASQQHPGGEFNLGACYHKG